ncbi:MAG: glutamine-hydrolyzing GMP synthase [Anaerolineaceae bacterium]|nr:glutamine-hydrolyzing GMP synthase [Anaerolineaceae bacterium]
MKDAIAILDFGSQYTQLIARRVRELNIYCEIFPWDAPQSTIIAIQPRGYILSGGPASAYDKDAPTVQDFILQSGMPILGICYGMQALTLKLNGKVIPAEAREYGHAEVVVNERNNLLEEEHYKVWMSHGDRIDGLPDGFRTIASSQNSPYAAIANADNRIFGLQFHPEVHHTPLGKDILKAFAVNICQVTQNWTADAIIEQSVKAIREQVGNQKVLSAVSGGVDSSVATALVYEAVGNQLSAVFVDHGLLRKNERQTVEDAFRRKFGTQLITVDAEDLFLSKLENQQDPEEKRKIIGETFIRTFEAEANKLGEIPFLVQGTIYPDVVESSAPDRNKAQRIKSHHNVGGLPTDLKFKLVEPLRYLFKDEVRKVGEALGLPTELVWRQPFPGPGLAVRCLGELSCERLSTLREADAIFTDELTQAGLISRRPKDDQPQIGQAFAVLLPVRSVGVMGDQRTYQEAIALRAVYSQDFMTANWAHIPYELLGKISHRIVNEVKGVNRVVYDITGKPPATIEWE